MRKPPLTVNPSYDDLRRQAPPGVNKDCAIRAWCAITGDSWEAGLAVLARWAGKTRDGWDHHFAGAGWPGILRAYREHGYCLADWYPKARTVRTLERELTCGHWLVATSGGWHCLAIVNGATMDWASGSLKRVEKVWRVTA